MSYKNIHTQFNVKDYGALGDGVTDDTTAITNTITMLDASGGGILFLPVGKFLYSSISKTLTNPIIICGPGTLLSNLNKTVNTIALRLRGSFITIDGITFDYVTPLNVDTDGAARPAAAHTMRLGGDGSTATTFYTDIVVKNCIINNSRNTPINVGYASRIRILDNTIHEALGNGIYTSDAVEDVTITGNIISRTGDDGIAILGDVNQLTAKRVTVNDNKIKQSYAHGIDLTGVDGGEIKNNQIDATWSNGILIWQDAADGLGPSSDLIVEGNIIRNAATYFGAGQYKTVQNGTAHGINVTGPTQTGVVIRNNKVLNPANRGIVTTGMTDANVVGNTVRAATIGFDMSSISASIIANNRAELCVGHGYSLASLIACTIQGNSAYNNNTAADGSSDNFNIASPNFCVIAGNTSVDDRGTAKIDVHFEFSGTGVGNIFGVNTWYSSKGNRFASGIGVMRLDLPAVPPQRIASGVYIAAPPGGGSGTSILSNDRLYAVPFVVPSAVTITEMNVKVTTGGSAGAVLRMGIYNDTGACAPGGLVTDAGTVAAVTSAALATITGLSIALQPGVYWAVVACQGSPVTAATLNVANGKTIGLPMNQDPSTNIAAFYSNSITGALAATFAISGQINIGPLFTLKVQ